MKILALNSSPNRDGATAKIIDIFVCEFKKYDVECERVDLIDYLVCEDCRTSSGERRCTESDDIIQLNAKMVNADGIIIASPFFYGKPSVELETFISRIALTFAYKRPFKDKYFVGISVSMHDECKKVAKYCAHLGGLTVYANGHTSSILCINRMNSNSIIEVDSETEILNKVSKTANKLIEDINKPRKSIFYKVKAILFRNNINYILIASHMFIKRFRITS
jgi:multimeric flavodoxin WrbA